MVVKGWVSKSCLSTHILLKQPQCKRWQASKQLDVDGDREGGREGGRKGGKEGERKGEREMKRGRSEGVMRREVERLITSIHSLLVRYELTTLYRAMVHLSKMVCPDSPLKKTNQN